MSVSLLSTYTNDLLQLARLYRSYIDKHLIGYGLSDASALTLVVIGRLGGGVKQNDVASALRIEGASLVRLLDQLENAGFLERKVAAHDRRVRLIFLTQSGQHLFVNLEKEIEKLRVMLFEGIPQEDLLTAINVFEQLKSKLLTY